MLCYNKRLLIIGGCGLGSSIIAKYSNIIIPRVGVVGGNCGRMKMEYGKEAS